MTKQITFNHSRTFGVELEVIGNDSYSKTNFVTELRSAGFNVITAGYHHTVETHGAWEVKPDGSLSANGFEVVSPKLLGQDGLDQLKAVMSILSRHANINRSCGMHVHHGVADFDDKAFSNLYRLGTAAQQVMNLLVSPSRRRNRYAQCWTRDEYLARRSPRALRRQLVYHTTRYMTINFASYAIRGTVEFRQHQGTTDFTKAAAWIVFTQRMVERAAEANSIRAKNVPSANYLFKLIGMKRHAFYDVTWEPDAQLAAAADFLSGRYNHFRRAAA
jgi:hypothetical protein